MTDTSPPAIRVDHDGDLWTPDGDRWACRTSPSQRPTLERLEFAHGPTVEYVPAARVAELETERDEARARVLRAEAQRMDWQLIHDRLDALVAQLRALGHPVTGELTDAPAAAEVGGETTAINGYFCAAILDHDHPCPTMCAAPVAQQGQRCSPQHAQPSYRPCLCCPEYARNAWTGTATTGGEADQ